MVNRKKMTTLGALIPATDTGAKKQGAVSTRRAALKTKAAPVAESVPPVADSGSKAAKAEMVKTSIYLPLPVYRELNQLTVNESHASRKKMHDYFMEAIDLLLKSKGRPGIAELVKKAGE